MIFEGKWLCCRLFGLSREVFCSYKEPRILCDNCLNRFKNNYCFSFKEREAESEQLILARLLKMLRNEQLGSVFILK